MRVLTLAVLACLAVAGCSVGAQTTGPVAAPNPMAANEASPADWSLGTPVPDEVDDHTVAVHFVTGTPECYGAYATVEETDTTVIVTLRTGALPEAADKMCILVAVFGSLDVPLSRPLGDRHVVNG